MVLTGTKQLYQVLAHLLSLGSNVDLTAVSRSRLPHSVQASQGDFHAKKDLVFPFWRFILKRQNTRWANRKKIIENKNKSSFSPSLCHTKFPTTPSKWFPSVRAHSWDWFSRPFLIWPLSSSQQPVRSLHLAYWQDTAHSRSCPFSLFWTHHFLPLSTSFGPKVLPSTAAIQNGLSFPSNYYFIESYL